MKIDTGFLRAHRRALIGGGLLLVAVVLAVSVGRGKPESQAQAPAGAGAAARPALSVTTTLPRSESWPEMLAAAGNVAAWQEATIGAEISNFRILEVRADGSEEVLTFTEDPFFNAPEDSYTFLEDGLVTIEDGRIVAVGPYDPQSAEGIPV